MLDVRRLSVAGNISRLATFYPPVVHVAQGMVLAMASISLCVVCVLLGIGTLHSNGTRSPEASLRHRLQMSVTFGLIDSPADTLVADVGDNQMFAAQTRSECGATRSIAGRLVAGRGGTYHAVLVIGDYNGWEQSSMQAIALDLVPGKPFGWAICGGIAQPYSVTLLRIPVGSSANAPNRCRTGLHVGAELAHAAERAQRDRSVALDAVARAR